MDMHRVWCDAHLYGGRSRHHALGAESMVALGTRCRSAGWCTYSSLRVHAMVPPGPPPAFMRPFWALACETQSFCGSDSTCRMDQGGP